jgi:acyl-coenzyme A thioesterase PaaI-like protein
MTDADAVQDHYADNVAHCYGCGRLNRQGLHLRTVWDGDETVTRFRPRPEHTGVPGFVHGGLICSLVDCHGTGTAAAAAYRAEGRGWDTDPPLRFVTASLHVDFLRPTPIHLELEVRGRVAERQGKRVVVRAEISAAGVVTARGEVVAVPMPETFAARPDDHQAPR